MQSIVCFCIISGVNQNQGKHVFDYFPNTHQIVDVVETSNYISTLFLFVQINSFVTLNKVFEWIAFLKLIFLLPTYLNFPTAINKIIEMNIEMSDVFM